MSSCSAFLQHPFCTNFGIQSSSEWLLPTMMLLLREFCTYPLSKRHRKDSIVTLCSVMGGTGTVSKFLSNNNKASPTLHRISDPRMGGNAKRNLRMCSQEFMHYYDELESSIRGRRRYPRAWTPQKPKFVQTSI